MVFCEFTINMNVTNIHIPKDWSVKILRDSFCLDTVIHGICVQRSEPTFRSLGETLTMLVNHQRVAVGENVFHNTTENADFAFETEKHKIFDLTIEVRLGAS